MILVITGKQDGHVGAVAEHIDDDWVRINTEDFATNVVLTMRPETGTSRIEILDSKKTFSLDAITSVWFRKPEATNLSHLGLTDSTLDYVEAEFNEILMGIYALLSGRLWVNDPFRTRIAHRKLLQLKVANDIGFKTPQTLISNDEAEVLSFAESVGWDVALKSLGAINVTNYTATNTAQQFGIFTRRIDRDELLEVRNTIGNLPSFYQSYIKKKYELRITCVGKKIFGCRIDSQSNAQNSEDMRFDIQASEHRQFDCSPIQERLLAYLDRFNLNFGCFDFAVDENDEFVFFECNPNGQWLWIEHATQMPISQALAELLSR